MVNQHPKKKEIKPVTLTRTQKRRLQRARSVQRMKQTLQMIADAKAADKKEIPEAKVAEAIDRAFGPCGLEPDKVEMDQAKEAPMTSTVAVVNIEQPDEEKGEPDEEEGHIPFY